MGFFDFLKKNKKENTSTNNFDTLSGKGMVEYIQSNLKNPTEENVMKVLDNFAKPDADLEHLTSEGELPCGWHTHTKEFTSKINGEYSCYLNLWLDARKKSPKELYSALKSFVLYLEDAEKLCKSKGECFEFWYYNILTTPDYLEKRKLELQELTETLEEKQKLYIKRTVDLVDIDAKIINKLKENPNVLQSDFVKMFDVSIQKDVKEKLYYMDKEGKLQRTKSGRSYILNYKGGDVQK